MYFDEWPKPDPSREAEVPWFRTRRRIAAGHWPIKPRRRRATVPDSGRNRQNKWCFRGAGRGALSGRAHRLQRARSSFATDERDWARRSVFWESRVVPHRRKPSRIASRLLDLPDRRASATLGRSTNTTQSIATRRERLSFVQPTFVDSAAFVADDRRRVASRASSTAA
ncbi:hypothetical protein C8039_12695 [Halogeometricum sp. wsp3]|nr:hypothetical protein C8039_12695 [Halogeometricum sp. wsp3]